MSLTWEEENYLLSRTSRYTTIRSTTADGHGDSVDGTGDDEQGGDPRDMGVRRMTSPGWDARPVNGTEALVVFSQGGRSNAVLVGVARTGDTPAIDEGEAVGFAPGAPTCRILFDKNGVLHIDATNTKDVVVNGGSLLVARKTDPIVAGTLSTTNAVIGGIPTTFILHTPGTDTPLFTPNATAPPTVAGTTVLWLTIPLPVVAAVPALQLAGVITDGAPHFKG